MFNHANSLQLNFAVERSHTSWESRRYQPTLSSNYTCWCLWTEYACFTGKGVFNVHYTHHRARNNHHAIREHEYQVRFSGNVWADIATNIVVGLCLLPDGLDSDFLEAVLPVMLEDLPLAVKQILCFHHDGGATHNGEAGLEAGGGGGGGPKT
jgi:hypothetical protein